MTGLSLGAAAGLLVAGPDGAIGGVAAGSVLASGLKEVAHRVLSRREQARVGGAFRSAATGFTQRIDAGDTVRDDGFFTSRPARRAKGKEIVEGILLAAQREHEERKVEFLGYLMANVCFESEVDDYLANWSIKTAQELTWGQFVLLSAFGRPDRSTIPTVKIGNGTGRWRSWGIHQQIADLGWGHREMILAKPEATPRLALSVPNLKLDEQQLSGGGSLLFHLMWLDRIPQSDVADVLAALQTPSP